MAKKSKEFKKAVEATPEVKACYKRGLQALIADHNQKIRARDLKLCEGSVEIDACVEKVRERGQSKYGQANRWDYAIGYDGVAYFVEVHSANTGEVATVLRKLEWLKTWLNEKAPELKKLLPKGGGGFYWIQSGKYAILRQSPQHRKALQKGLFPMPHLNLPPK